MYANSGFAPCNDCVSSVKVGSGVYLDLFNHADFSTDYEGYQTGWRYRYSGNVPYVGDYYNDGATSARVVLPQDVNCQHPGPYEVALFVDANYDDSYFYGDDCIVKRIGSYESSAAMGIHNDSISSIKFGTSAAITIFQQWNYGPYYQELRSWVNGDIPYLGALSFSWNDQISSVQVW
jgi:hypothetical protein